MKDAPINLPPLPPAEGHKTTIEGDRGLFYFRDTVLAYARAAVLADRAAASAEPPEKMHLAYRAIDRFLRNNLDDTDYSTYSEHLEMLWPDPPAAPVQQTVVNLLTDICSILNVVEQEWRAQNAWSEFDQSVRNRITEYLRNHYER